MADRELLLEELLEVGIALTAERDLYALLERMLELARRFTRAEAGTLFLREGDHLRFAVVQNDFLERKLGAAAMQQRLQSEPLRLTEPSLAGHVAQTGEIVNVADAYAIGVHETRALNRRFDTASEYSTRSVLAVPMLDLTGSSVGVLELLNARDESGAIVPFDPDDEKVDPGARLAGRRRDPQRTARGPVVQGRLDRAVQPPLFRAADRRGGQASHPVRPSAARSSS